MGHQASNAFHRLRLLIRPLYPLCVAALVWGSAGGAANAQTTESVLHNFTGGTDGATPYGSLLVDASPSRSIRALFGTASAGGTSNFGAVFQMTPPKRQGEWRDSTLWSFTDSSDGQKPSGALFADTRRVTKKTPLYGTAAFGGASGNGTVFSLVGKVLTSIWTFTGGGDGGNPYYNVVSDSSGALYTSAIAFGGPSSCGTVIKLTPPVKGQTAWTETTIWTFTNGNDGCSPNGLIIDKAGALYGTTYQGGVFDGLCTQGGGTDYGCGTVFKLTPPAQGQNAWTEQTLWGFRGGNDGANSDAAPVAVKNGVIYGTTIMGGGATNCTGGCGIVFQLTPPKKGPSGWTETIPWAFSGGNDGGYPFSSVIIDTNGDVFGTASAFGAQAGGTAYRLVPPVKGQKSWTETTLFGFGGSNGATPFDALVADPSGVLYGTTSSGGTDNFGNVFSLSGTGFEPE